MTQGSHDEYSIFKFRNSTKTLALDREIQNHTLAEISPNVDPRGSRHELLDCDTAFFSTRLSISAARADAGYFA